MHVVKEIFKMNRAPTPALRKIAATTVQPKMRESSLMTASRSAGYAASGVVQANVVGGNHALQARLNLWNTRLTGGVNSRVLPATANVPKAPGAKGARAIQRKTG